MATHSQALNTIESNIRADHDILVQGALAFHKLFQAEHSSENDRKLADIQHQFQQQIEDHFTAEDTNLFPTLLTKYPDQKTARLIDELKHEHITLLEMLHGTNAMIAQRGLNKMTGEIWLAMLKFFNQLQNHMDKEDQFLDNLR